MMPTYSDQCVSVCDSKQTDGQTNKQTNDKQYPHLQKWLR